MSYLKFNADAIFTGSKMLGREHVLVTDYHGTIIDTIALSEAGEDVRYLPGLLSPGFINCHCHLELSHLKGRIPERTGLVDFVCRVVTERHFSVTEILTAIEQAEDEMLQNGTVAVGDICNNDLTLSQKSKGRLAYYNFIEVSGWLPAVAGERYAKSKAFATAFALRSNTGSADVPVLSKSSIVPHAPYSVSMALWELLQDEFAGKTVTIHNQETAFEDALFSANTGDFLRMYQQMKIDNGHFKPTGKSSLRSYFHMLRPAENIILVHNTFTPEQDIVFASEEASANRQSLFWCICINANIYIEDTAPPVNQLLENNCNIVLGTDSLASNHSLDLLDEMKTLQKRFPQLKAENLLTFATSNGARALQMEQVLGSFVKGKRPGIVCIEGIHDNVLSPQAKAKRIL